MIQQRENEWNLPVNTMGRSDYSFYESEDGEYCIFYSEIGEYESGKYASPVQIWTDKSQPRIVYDSGRVPFEYQFNESCYYLPLSRMPVLLGHCGTDTRFTLRYLLFHFEEALFVTIEYPNFELLQIDANSVELKLKFRHYYSSDEKKRIALSDKKLIDLPSLNWKNIKEIKSLGLMLKGVR
jgi:hypothetical protein